MLWFGRPQNYTFVIFQQALTSIYNHKLDYDMWPHWKQSVSSSRRSALLCDTDLLRLRHVTLLVLKFLVMHNCLDCSPLSHIHESWLFIFFLNQVLRKIDFCKAVLLSHIAKSSFPSTRNTRFSRCPKIDTKTSQITRWGGYLDLPSECQMHTCALAYAKRLILQSPATLATESRTRSPLMHPIREL